MSEQKPKRTRKPRAKSKGLGDSIEKVTKATGIDKAVKFIAGEDCGCQERKEFLNKLFPYKQMQCLSEEDYNYLTLFFEAKESTLAPSQQRVLLTIYNKTFNTKEQMTSCPDCWRKMISELKKVYNEY
jgi:hypothetical protein